MSVGNLVREAGFHIKPPVTHFFVDSLKKAGIPITRKEVVEGERSKNLFTYILLLRHKDRAVQVLNQDQYLQRFRKNPVTLFCGPEDTQLPTTTPLINKEGYESVGKIFKKFGMRVGGRSNIRYSDIFTPDCPVPIFYVGNTYYFPVTQEKKLRLFIAKRLNL